MSECPLQICPCPENRRAMLAFTFDDGTPDHYQAAQALQSFGWRGTFYVNPRANDRPYARRLTWAQMAEMASAGHEIGVHTMTHRRLDFLEQQQDFPGMAWEIAECVRQITANVGVKPLTYTAPYGHRPEFICELLAQHSLLETPGRVHVDTHNTAVWLEKEMPKWTAPGTFTVLMFHGILPGYGGYDAPEREECFGEILTALSRAESLYCGTFADTGFYRLRHEHTELREIRPGEYFLRLDPAYAAFAGALTLTVPDVHTPLRINGIPLRADIDRLFQACTGDVVSVG